MATKFLCIGGPLDGVRGTTTELATRNGGRLITYTQYNGSYRDRRIPSAVMIFDEILEGKPDALRVALTQIAEGTVFKDFGLSDAMTIARDTLARGKK